MQRQLTAEVGAGPVALARAQRAHTARLLHGLGARVALVGLEPDRLRQLADAALEDRMALLGTAALAMWWDIAPDIRADFEDWHAHEHFPERMGIPGFRRGTRWSSASGGEGMFVMYEMADHDVLSSPGYVARLNAPTPWSTRLMPHHRNMVRSQCRVLESRGSGLARGLVSARYPVGHGHSSRTARTPLSSS